ncbi:MAG: Alpha-methylacyl-CoA racemase [Myxococcaceae bacterium]|nr:Alpha-methylacyl-CoA racemase [Myxococcaceae bacterium]
MLPESLRHRRPLEGVRVLDLTRLLPGPFASLVLADLGAAVDKLEDPAPGDYLRHMPPAVDGQGAAWQALNRDKRSLVIDLKHPDGVAALREIVPRYDVLIEGFRPGVLDRLGVGHAALRALHPGLIVCAITGYGQDGPLAKRAGHDLNYLARAGVLGVTGPAGAAPAVSGAQMADVAGGALWAVVAILAALHDRARTGVGCVADVAMSEGAVPLAAFALASLVAGERPRPRGDNVLDGGIAAYSTYLTSDGGAVALGALEPKFWTAFASAVGLDASLDALVPGPHQPGLKAAVAAVIAGRTRAEWEAFARSHDCCIEPVLEPHELPADPQHQHRGVFFEAPGFGGNPTLAFRTPVGAGADGAHTPPRAAGADTRAILREAGMDDARIDALASRGAVGV